MVVGVILCLGVMGCVFVVMLGFGWVLLWSGRVRLFVIVLFFVSVCCGAVWGVVLAVRLERCLLGEMKFVGIVVGNASFAVSVEGGF